MKSFRTGSPARTPRPHCGLRLSLALAAALAALAFSAAAWAQDAPANQEAQPGANSGAAPVTPQASSQTNSDTTPDSQPAQPQASSQTAPENSGANSSPVGETPKASPSTNSTSAVEETGAAAAQGGVTEEELKHRLVGKSFYIRDGYLSDALNFNEHGRLVSHSPQGSYTLSAIQIDHVRLTKHKVELEGARFGLHFLGQLAYEDQASAPDRVKITPKKKVVKITIDREIVVKPKKTKEKGKKANEKPDPPQIKSAPAANPPEAAGDTSAAAGTSSPAKETSTASAAAEPGEMSEADQLKASIAAAPEAERPADTKSVTTTTSPAHAAKVLDEALDSIFAPSLDERMMARMPEFWKLYYQAVAAKADYRPKDPSILRQNTVDKKARLLTNFEPPSNEYAQTAGVAGMTLYHVVVNPDGAAGEIAVARPIGFGLDENAVESIRKAKFEPAMKDGKPVAVMLDLVVQFRIYSKRTSVASSPEGKEKAGEAVLPGPYTVQQK